MNKILKTLEEGLNPLAGLYNKEVPEKNQVVDFNNPNNLCVVIGNSKKLWKPFLEYVSKQPTIPQNPIDTFTKQSVENVLKNIEIDYHIHYAFDYDHIVSMQKLAYLSGMCYLSPKTHLCYHPKFGVWMGLRAAIIFNCLYEKEPPQLIPPVEPEIEEKQGELINKLIENKEYGNPEVAKKWIEFRDLCEVGKEYRYSENQLWYHYTKDVQYIQNALNDLKNDIIS